MRFGTADGVGPWSPADCDNGAFMQQTGLAKEPSPHDRRPAVTINAQRRPPGPHGDPTP